MPAGLAAPLRVVAWIVLVIGAVGSQAFMLYFGRNNQHTFITILFVVWVLGPFVVLAVLARLVRGRSLQFRALTFVVMLVVSLSSLLIYTYNFLSPRVSQPAFVFVAVPIGSGLLIGICVVIGIYMLPKQSDR